MRKKNLPFGTPIRVMWVDSSNRKGWIYNREELGEVTQVISIGFTLKSTPDTLTLASSIGNSGEMLTPLTVPWKAITDLQEIPGDWL